MHVRCSLKRCDVSQLLCDCVCILTNQNQSPHLGSNQVRERLVRSFLSSATKNQYDFAGFASKCLKCLQSCINTGCFRIVVELHPVQFGNKLESMFHGIKTLNCVAHRPDISACGQTNRYSSSNVFNIVKTAQL